MSILFLACLLAICLPILSVQIPRLYPSIPTLMSFVKSRSTSETENQSPLHERTPPLGRSVRQRGTAAASRSAQSQGRGEATDGADSGAGTSETGSEEIHIQPTAATRLLSQSLGGKGKDKADERQARKKPWDPPFPRREDAIDAGKERVEWRILPSTPRKSGREMEAHGVAKRLFPSDSDSYVGYIHEEENRRQPSEAEGQMTPRPSSTPAHILPAGKYTSSTTPQPTGNRKPEGIPRVVSGIWLCLAILAALLFILAFAILIAHCLAWFLVYKTEARLGEARRGIMHGGEMRLCLCAT